MAVKSALQQVSVTDADRAFYQGTPVHVTRTHNGNTTFSGEYRHLSLPPSKVHLTSHGWKTIWYVPSTGDQ